MKINATVQAQYCVHSKEFQYSVFKFEDMQSSGYTAVHSVEIEFDEPPHEVLAAGTVAAYRAEQKRIQAEAQMKITELEQNINDLLCLENKSDV